MTMRITIDRDGCTGCACCMMEAPNVFDIDDASGQVIVLVSEPGEDLRDEVERGIRSCPENVIALEIV
jgi:ferredoxin